MTQNVNKATQADQTSHQT